MELLKQILTYVVVIALLWAALTWIPRLTSRVRLGSDYVEITVPNIEEYPSYSLEAGLPFDALAIGDAVCYRTVDAEGGASEAYGFIAARPGDTVAIAAGELLVNGKPDKRCGALSGRPDAGPLVIPAQHLYVVTTMHQTDSVARGPLAAADVRGRLKEFP